MPLNLVSRLADRMGNANIRAMRAKQREASSLDASKRDELGDPEREELWAMKRLIKERPDAFILNNVILAVHLFSNYEREMEDARRKLEAKEQKLNQKLLPVNSVLLPDVLHEHFTDRVRLTAQSGKSDTDDVTVEPIRPIRVYVIYENVFVSEVDESHYYSNPSELTIEYNFVLREANHKGYARLEQRKTTAPKENPGSDNTDLSSIAENETEIYSDDGSVYGPISNRNVLLAMIASKSMPDLLDDDNYYDEQSASLSNGHDHARVASNGRIPLRSQRLPNSGSSSSSGSTTPAYGLDSDSDSSSLSSAYLRHNNNSDSRSGSSSHHRNNNNKSSWLTGCDIPPDCMKTVTFTYDGRIYNPKREPKALTRQQRRIRDAKIAKNKDVVYVNGYKLAKYFYEGFKVRLGKLLNFDESTVRNAKRCDATIRLETIEHLSPKDQSAYVKIEPYEVIPCFASPWPKWARGWLERRRSDWPSYEQLRRAENFGCCLVPETSRPHSTNDEPSHPLWKLDWSLSFPGAERYLETCLSASQATVFAVALVLHKTFLRALGPSFGLETGHVRNMLFLMAEKSPEWSMLQMGQWTINLLESLHGCIQQRAMPDYFMHERNVFASVNPDDLLHAQKQLKRIIDNPVMFVLYALGSVGYESDAEACRRGSCLCCYPRLDHSGLLKLLLTRHELILRNSNLQQHSTEEQQQGPLSSSSSSSSSAGYYTRREAAGKDFWTEAKQNSQQYIMQTRKRSDKIAIAPRREHDSVIDIQESCEPLTPIRLSIILEFFAEHFLRVARCCHERGATRSKRAYLDQAKLLAGLLAEDPDYQDSSRSLLHQVREMRERESSPDVPPIPRRNLCNADTTIKLRRQVSYATTTNDESKDTTSSGTEDGELSAVATPESGRDSDWPIFLGNQVGWETGRRPRGCASPRPPDVPVKPETLRSLRRSANRPVLLGRQVVADEDRDSDKQSGCADGEVGESSVGENGKFGHASNSKSNEEGDAAAAQ